MQIESTMGVKEAIDLAIEEVREWECIGSFLYRCKSEVSVMLLTEFDEKKHEDNLINFGKEKGEKEGREKERYEKMCEMITMNFPIESITKLYKVTVDYVLRLKKELDNNDAQC